MPDTWTDITKPAVGDPTKKQAFADKVIDNLTFLRANMVAARDIIPNGSFELDSDANSIPDLWTHSNFTGGSTTLDTTAGNFIHGGKALKFVHPGGGGNGGGTLTSTNFLDWSEKRPMLLAWAHKSSAAAMRDKVEIQWFDSAQALISTSAVYDSQANPTSWTEQTGAAYPPTNTRYAKLKITGGDSSVSTGGSSYWDDFRILEPKVGHQLREMDLRTAGTYTWVAPLTGTVELHVIGGGGGGGGGDGGGSSTGGGGGGAGGYSVSLFDVTSGTTYTVVVGAAGTAGAITTNGGGGGNSSFGGVVTANGGNGGVHGGGAGTGGAGGSASSGVVNVTGGSGGNRSGSTGGNGGIHPLNRLRAAGGTGTANNGNAGALSGDGGGGGSSGNATGGAGVAGRVIIRWFIQE
jgi:hypothetical protein